MNLDQAIEKHTQWKMKLRSAISNQETLDVLSISKDNCCDFGKWLHGEAKPQVGHLASYADTVSRHSAFHVEAGKVASAINAKKYTEAEAMLGYGTPYESTSSAVGVSIIRLKKEAKL